MYEDLKRPHKITVSILITLTFTTSPTETTSDGFLIYLSLINGMENGKILLGYTFIAAWMTDTIAYCVGVKFGKHKLYKKKSYEGTIAMFITAFVSVFVILLIRGNVPWYFVCLVSFVTALSSAATELFTPNGYDTITCPIASMISMLLALFICGGLV